MKIWQSIGFGVVETSGDMNYGNGTPESLIVLPIWPSPPLRLNQSASKLWLKCADVAAESQLDSDELLMISEFVDTGIACQEMSNLALRVDRPVLDSIEHELVYALIARLCNKHSIEYVFIKGPIQYEYGLRERKHSGDVDVWIDPNRIYDFIRIIEPWGWNPESERWRHSHFNHSITLDTDTWGCQIDVHRYFPGSTASPTDAFKAVMGWRTSRQYAGVPVRVLSKPSAAVLFTLHGLRPEARHKKKTMDTSDAAKALLVGGRETVKFSDEFACTDVLYQALSEAFPDEIITRTNKVPVDWKWRSEPNWIRAYFMILRSLQPVDWLSFFKDLFSSPTQSRDGSFANNSGIKRIIHRVSPRMVNIKCATKFNFKKGHECLRATKLNRTDSNRDNKI